MKHTALLVATAMLTMGLALAPTASATHENRPDCVPEDHPVCVVYDAIGVHVDYCDDGEVGLVVNGAEVCVTPPDPGSHKCPSGTIGGGTDDVWLCLHFNGCNEMTPWSGEVCMP